MEEKKAPSERIHFVPLASSNEHIATEIVYVYILVWF